MGPQTKRASWRQNKTSAHWERERVVNLTTELWDIVPYALYIVQWYLTSYVSSSVYVCVEFRTLRIRKFHAYSQNFYTIAGRKTPQWGT